MSNYTVRKRNQRISKCVNTISAAASLFVGATIQLDLSDPSTNWDAPIIIGVITLIKNHAPMILIVIGALLLLSYIGMKYTHSAIILKCVETKLDVIRDWLCSDVSQDFNDNHRVTLFQYKPTYFGLWSKKRFWSKESFPWTMEKNPFSGWLVPVARSGYTSQKFRTAFWTPDEGKKCEGIAGVAWGTNNTVHIDKLPKIIESSSSANFDKYCRITLTPRSVLESYIKEKRIPARSFLAFPILKKDGTPWGVVVIDSQSESGIAVDEVQRAVSVSGPVLAVLLEEL